MGKRLKERLSGGKKVKERVEMCKCRMRDRMRDVLLGQNSFFYNRPRNAN